MPLGRIMKRPERRGKEENNEWTENIRSISRRITKRNKNGTKSKWKSWKELRSNVTRMKGWKGLDKLLSSSIFFFFFREKSFGLNFGDKSPSSHSLSLCSSSRRVGLSGLSVRNRCLDDNSIRSGGWIVCENIEI